MLYVHHKFIILEKLTKFENKINKYKLKLKIKSIWICILLHLFILRYKANNNEHRIQQYSTKLKQRHNSHFHIYA